MLPDQLRILISAYACGDLSPRRRSAAKRLLQHSQDARDLLRQLRDDTRRLQQMSKPNLPAEFTNMVMSRLAAEPIIVRPPVAKANRWPVMIGTVAAVCATAAVCAGIWMLGPESATRPTDDLSIARGSARIVEVSPAPSVPAPKNVVDPPTAGSPAIVRADPPARVETAPSSQQPAPANNAALASPTVVLPNLATVAVPRIAEFFAPQALDQRSIRDSLAAELTRAEAHRLDLFCRDCNRGFERLQAGLKERGVQIVIDPMAADWQKKRRTRGWYLLYCDDLSVADWCVVLSSSGVADRKADERKAGDGVLEQVAVLPLTGLDQKELTTLFGTDPTAPITRSRSLDLRRSVSEDTAEQVAKAVSAPSATKAQKRAFVAPLLPAAPIRTAPTTLRDARQFTDPDRERRPGAIAMMVIIRLAS